MQFWVTQFCQEGSCNVLYPKRCKLCLWQVISFEYVDLKGLSQTILLSNNTSYEHVWLWKYVTFGYESLLGSNFFYDIISFE